MSGPWTNYTRDGGYDPDDGLDETRGRWMWDDERNIRVWVWTVDDVA